MAQPFGRAPVSAGASGCSWVHVGAAAHRPLHAEAVTALIDGELSVAARSLAAAVRKSVDRMLSEDSSLITLYYGEDITREEAQDLADHLTKEHPSLEVETVPGGQPHYPYIVSVE